MRSSSVSAAPVEPWVPPDTLRWRDHRCVCRREDHGEFVDRLDLILDDTQGGTTAEGIHLGATTRVVPLPTRPTPPPDR